MSNSFKVAGLAAAILAGVALLGIIVLSAISHPVPASLDNALYILLGAAGTAIPTGVAATVAAPKAPPTP